jgi:hypothetical protein
MSLEVAAMAHSKQAPAEFAGGREELVRRVAASVTFEKSPRLRAFLLHVCRCAIEDKPEEATEQQIGIHVYGRSPSYNPTEDNIVRSQARILRMKLEHHFANEGKDEATVITIPKGQYVPLFESRPILKFTQPAAPPPLVRSETRSLVRPTARHLGWVLAGAGVLFGLLVTWMIGEFRSRPMHANLASAVPPAESVPAGRQPEVYATVDSRQSALLSNVDAVRIAAGHTGAPYVDAWGHRWDADRYYDGGVVRPGPSHFFPPIADEGLFRTMREAASGDNAVPPQERAFQYNIPLSPGTYELRLFFADQLRQPDVEQDEDAQNMRHLEVLMNEHPLLEELDPIADAGSAAVDERVFKDVRPAADGKLHLEFRSGWGRPAFVSAIELTPGTPGRLSPIRIAARRSDFADADGKHWSGDRDFIDGRTGVYTPPRAAPKVPALYAVERHGNFSYSIPVAPGSYTIRLHFLESFFSPLIPDSYCHGIGCRVFDVSCNGNMLLQDFDISQAAGGAFVPVIREFHGIHPNGQGKLLISFSPKVNYAEVRAIEVIDEAK